jgi:hypothetical protein
MKAAIETGLMVLQEIKDYTNITQEHIKWLITGDVLET